MGETLLGGIKNEMGAIKSIYNQSKVNRKLTGHIMSHAGLEPTVMGEKNYNKAFSTIKGYLKKNDISSAHSYADTQARAIQGQKKAAIPTKVYPRIKK